MDIDQPLTLLGGLTPAQFMKRHWHKKPLLVRQAIPDFKPCVDRAELVALAAQDGVESRLIVQGAQGWQMKHGPLTRRSLPPFKQKNWTFLVQGVDLHHEGVHQLLQRFRFVPDARLDDLMISYASDGGGVGPHFDSYDVFLLQAHGRRRWRIGRQKDLGLQPGVPLRILQRFEPEQEFVLEPGDMLYLPPKYAHDGIAEGECMTWSIGFRAPGSTELARGFLEFLSEQLDLPGRYSDPHLKLPKHRAQISADMLDQVEAMIGQIQWDRTLIRDFLGRYLTEPKPQVFFEGPEETGGAMSAARFAKQLKKCGVRLHRKTQLLFSGARFFINGEALSVPSADQASMRTLADTRKAGADTEWSLDCVALLRQWHEDGFVVLSEKK